MYWIVQPVYKRIPEGDYKPTGPMVAINPSHVQLVELGKVTLKIRLTSCEDIIVMRDAVPWLLRLLGATPVPVV